MKLFLLGMEHECATRVPDKSLRPFAGTTLFDIYLKKFKALQDCDLFSGQGIALWKGDKRLWAKAEEAGVPIIERSKASARGHGDYKVIFEFLKDVDAERIERVNCCAPFLRASTWQRFARHSQEPVFGPDRIAEGFTSVRSASGWYWGNNDEPLGVHAGATQRCLDWTVSTQGINVFRPEVLLQHGKCWLYANSHLDPFKQLVYEPFEWIDIDTEGDFDLARRIAESFTEEEWESLYRLPRA